MKHRYPVHHRVTARHNNIVVAIQEASDRAGAEALAARMEQVPGTDVEIEEIPDPAETDLTALSRDISESVGWRRPPDEAEQAEQSVGLAHSVDLRSERQRHVLVGVEPVVDGTERLLAAFPDGPELVVPVEVDRPSNQAILTTDTVFIHDAPRTVARPSRGRRSLTDSERQTLERQIAGPLGDGVELLRLGPAKRGAVNEEGS